MEKPVKVIPGSVTSPTTKQRMNDGKPLSSIEEIRRQLGWGLIADACKGRRR